MLSPTTMLEVDSNRHQLIRGGEGHNGLAFLGARPFLSTLNKPRIDTFVLGYTHTLSSMNVSYLFFSAAYLNFGLPG